MKASLARLLAIIMMALTGCVGLPTVEMSDTDRIQVKTITIRTDNRLPDMWLYYGKSRGPVGFRIGPVYPYEPREQLLSTMKTNNIDLPLILQTEFTQAMQSQKDFRVAMEGASADAEMLLIVNLYGLNTLPGDIWLLVPLLNVSASLRTPDGRVVWQRTDVITANYGENRDGHELEKYIEQPELLREAWVRVSRIVNPMLVKHLSRTQ